VLGIFYTLTVGIWVCTFLVGVGLLLCLTLIGLPFGLTLIALGFKSLTLAPRPRVHVYYVHHR
jgi:uncharacterized membrane protein YccF (DUF307 family)